MVPAGDITDTTASQRPGMVQPPPGSVRIAWTVTRGSNQFEVPRGVSSRPASTAATSFAIFVTALMPFSGSVGCAVRPTAVTFQVEMPG